MKLIINASTLSGTGVTQVAVSFIEECKRFEENYYFVFLSNHVYSQVEIEKFPSNFKFYVIDKHPRYFIEGYSTRRYLRTMEAIIKPDCVFSIFGPSYWTPKAPHLMGYAYPHYVYPESPVFDIMTVKDKIRFCLYKKIHKYFLKKNGFYYVCETEDVSNRLKKYLGISSDRVYTVSNTYNHYFDQFKLPLNSFVEKDVTEFKFLSLCSFAVHKNLQILNQVIPLLNDTLKNIKIIFVLTVDSKSFKYYLSEEAKKSIVNLGIIDVSKCPQLYNECDALFLPILLECFSANYVEAMKMRKPIVTSNLPFATNVCKNAALYFDPMNAYDIVEKISLLVRNKQLYRNLCLEGDLVLKGFKTSQERAKSYLEICKSIIRKV